MKKTNEPLDPNTPKSRLHRLGLFGLVSRWPEVASQPWIEQLLDIEEAERKRRSLDRRLRNARIGSFKAIDRFDWKLIGKKLLVKRLRQQRTLPSP